jgi:hypothetical protein
VGGSRRLGYSVLPKGLYLAQPHVFNPAIGWKWRCLTAFRTHLSNEVAVRQLALLVLDPLRQITHRRQPQRLLEQGIGLGDMGVTIARQQRLGVVEQVDRILGGNLRSGTQMGQCRRRLVLHQEQLAEGAPGKGFAGGGDPDGMVSPQGPVWIGKDFRLDRNPRAAASNSTSGGGSGGGSTARRPHWRRGHWHTVLHGEKRQSRRMQWFQPVYVGLS